MLNNCAFIGRLAKDIEKKTTQSGVSVTSFDLAVDRDFKDKQGNKETDWIPCVAWRHDADYLAQYAHKGDLVNVIGRLTPRKWQDKNGQNRVSYEIQVNNVYLLGSGKPKEAKAPVAQEPEYTPIEDDGSLPF